MEERDAWKSPETRSVKVTAMSARLYPPRHVREQTVISCTGTASIERLLLLLELTDNKQYHPASVKGVGTNRILLMYQVRMIHQSNSSVLDAAERQGERRIPAGGLGAGGQANFLGLRRRSACTGSNLATSIFSQQVIL